MPKFSTILTFSQISRAEVIIKAKSLAEAKYKADNIAADEVLDWNPIGGEITVNSVSACFVNPKSRKRSAKKKFVPLTSDQIEDRIGACPDGSDAMFWRQDEIARIQREHRE